VTALRVVGLVTLLGLTLLLPGAGGPLAVAGVWMLCLAIVVCASPKGVLSLAPLYLVALAAFHLGVVVPGAFGIRPDVPPSWLKSAYLGKALGLFSTAAVAFTLGAASTRREAAYEETSFPQSQRELFLVGCGVAALGATLLWTGVHDLGLLSARYSAYFERAIREDVRFFGFGLMLFPIGLLVAAVGATPRQMFALGAILAVVLGPLFLRGFRGPVMIQATTLVAVWAHKDVRVARYLAVAGALAALVLVPVIRATRDSEAGSSRSVRQIDPAAGLLETGGSLQPLTLTAERVDLGLERLWMGRSYVMAIKRIVPNVSKWAPASGLEMAPSVWATMHADPWAYDHAGGVGFSGVAEPYLNFGATGVVLVFLLLGFVVHRWDCWLTVDPFRAAIGAASFGGVLWTVRNDSMELFRVLAFASATVLAARVAAAFSRRGRDLEPASGLEATDEVAR
jgi:hypothetical protein